MDPTSSKRAIGLEWFDREYGCREVYKRLWGYTRGYRKFIFAGLLMGMLVGGTWWPILNVVQPIIQEMQATPQVVKTEAPAPTSPAASVAPATISAPAPGEAPLIKGDTKEVLKINSQVSQYEELLAKVGIDLRNDEGEIGGGVITLLVLIVILGMGTKEISTYLNQYFLAKAAAWVVCKLRNEMFCHLQAQSLAFYGRVDVGLLMSRTTGDPNTIQTIISSTLAELCRAPFEVATSLIFVGYFTVKNDMTSMLFVVLVGYPLCMFPLIVLGKAVRRWSLKTMQRGATIVSSMHESMTCVRIVKAYHTEADENQKFIATSINTLKAVLRSTRLSLLMKPLTEGVAVILMCLFLAYCFCSGKTLADIIPLIPPFLILYKPLKELGRINVAIENGRAALTRIFSLLDVDTALPEASAPVAKTELECDIVFDHVRFQYVPEGDWIVDDSSFTIQRGQMYAVVGSTGSGKSTLANLLARFYDPTSGRVLVDGVDIRDIAIKDVRNLIGVVSQEALLFNTTIADNIKYGSPNATRTEIVEAAKRANAHDFIMQHAEGYDRVVGEKGFVLSGGERQRICIARAILKNPPILILDEATSALDTVTEQQVQAAITQLMEHRTVFAIAHRLSTIKRADCILVLDKGVIKERGTHDELYALGGIYRHLCDVQQQERNS